MNFSTYRCFDFVLIFVSTLKVVEELTALTYGSSVPRGLIEPHSSVDVPILVQVHEVGEQEATAHFSVFGSSDPAMVSQDGLEVLKLCWYETMYWPRIL